MTPTSTPRIDQTRLLARLASLAEVGAIDGTTGCCRLAFTDADRHGRDLVITWMRDLGLDVTIDGIGNAVGTWVPDGVDPTLAPVMTGSHIDTVATGGRYDGNLGVLAGLEVIETLIGSGRSPSRPLAVAFFSNEEGARFPPDMMGSLVYVGGLGLEEALAVESADGAVVGDELTRIGYRGPAPSPGLVPHAFVELHIEQGPVLEREGTRIGGGRVGPGDLVDRGHHRGPVEPRRHHPDGPPSRRRLRRGQDRHRGAGPGHRARVHPRWPPSGPSTSTPTWSTWWRPAPSSPSISATPTTRS